MQKWSRGFAVVVSVVLLSSGVSAQEPTKEAASPTAVTMDATFLSAYMWRGQALNDEAVFQPAVTITKGIFMASVWGNYNLTDRVTGETADFSEVDVTLSLAGKFGPVGATAGLIEYVFPNQTAAGAAVQGTREVFLTLSCPGWVVVPSVSVYRDVDEVDGTYATAGLSWTTAVGAKMALTVSGSIGYGDKDYNGIYFGLEDAALNDANVGLSLAWKVSDTITVVPSVQYTTLADTDIKDSAAGIYRDDSLVIGGVKVSWGL
jgi:hypothetical protein